MDGDRLLEHSTRSGRARVLQVITWMDLGGAQDHLLHLVRGLDHRRYDVTVAVGTSDGSRGELFEAMSRSARVVPLRHLRREISLVHDPPALAELGRLMDRVRPDIVHTHSSKAGVLGRIAASRRGIRTVHNVHGWSFRAATNPATRRLAVAVERRLAGRTDVLLNVSEADRVLGERLGIRARVRTEVVRGGIDLPAFRPEGPARGSARDDRVHVDVHADEPGGRGAPPVIGTIGRLTPAKDPSNAIDAVRLLAHDRPGIRFRWIGDGPLRPQVQERIDRLGLGGNIELLGNRTDVASELHALDVFVLSSRFEGLPRSLMEAAAAGVPIVATSVGGVEELIEDRRSGLVVASGDPVALARAIAEVIDDPVEAQTRVQAASLAANDYSIEAMCTRTAAVYESILP